MCNLLRLVAVALFLLRPEVALLNVTTRLARLIGQLVGSCNGWFELSVERRINFAIGREQYDLMAGLGKVVLHQPLTMLAVEATKWCVDDDRKRAPRDDAQRPEDGNGVDLLLARRELFTRDGVALLVVERCCKAVRLNRDALDVLAFTTAPPSLANRRSAASTLACLWAMRLLRRPSSAWIWANSVSTAARRAWRSAKSLSNTNYH